MDNSYFNWKQKDNLEQDLGPYTPPQDVPPLIRTKETGDKVYLIDKEGFAHWITSPEVLQAVGGDFGMIQTIDRSVFRQLRITDKITLETAPEYIIIKDPQEPAHKADAPGVSFNKPVSPEDFKSEKGYQVDEEAARESAKEFATYPEPEIVSAPQAEPVKGLTSIIIPVHWNSYPVFHYTGNCIGSIREHTDKEKTPYEIILVINGKTGITIDNLKETYTDKVIMNEENEGYSKAVNKAIRCASGEYIAIVNNDVQVFDHWLEDMQSELTHEDLQGLDLVMATPMYGKPFARASEAKELREKSFKGDLSDFRDFSCVLTRKKMFDQIGLFDEQFFMYCEDLDLLRRMDQEGLKYASTKRVNTSHIIGATSGTMPETAEIMNESKAKLKAKWGE